MKRLKFLLKLQKKAKSWGYLLSVLGLFGLSGFCQGLDQYNRHEREDLTFQIGLVFFILFVIPSALIIWGELNGKYEY